MSNLSELLPAGAGAKSASFVASGTLPSGQTVVVNADGTVSAIGSGTPVTKSIPAAAVQVFNNSDTQITSIAFDPSSPNEFVIAFTSASVLKAIAGSLSGTTATFGTAVTVGNGNDAMSSASVAFNPNVAKQFVIVFVDANDSYKGKIRLGTVSSNEITLQSTVIYDATTTGVSDSNSSVAFDPNTSGKLAIVYKGSTGNGNVLVCSISGTTITVNSPVQFGGGATNQLSFSFDPNTANKLVIVYQDGFNGDYGTSVIATISGTGVTFGSLVVFESAGSIQPYVDYNPATANHFAIAYKGSGQDGKSILGTVSGTTISYPAAAVTFATINAESTCISFDPNTTNKFVISYREYNGTAYKLYIVEGTASSTTVSLGTPIEIFNKAGNPTTRFNPTASSAGQFMTTFEDADDPSDVGTLRLGQIASTAILGNTGFVGITDEAISSAASGSVIVQGGVITNTGLIPDALSAGAQSVYQVGPQIQWQAVAYDSTNNRVVVAYSDNNSTGKAAVGTVSGTTITWGTPVQFSSHNSPHIAISYDTNAQKIVIGYKDNVSSPYGGQAVVGTVSGTSISFGSPVQFAALDMTSLTMTYDANAQKTVFAYLGQSNYTQAIVGTVSGTSISFGTAYTVLSEYSGDKGITYDSTAQKVVLATATASTTGKAAVGTVSGTSISFGTAATFVSTQISEVSVSYNVAANKTLICYRADGLSNQGKTFIATVSGTSISFGAISEFDVGGVSAVSATYDVAAQTNVISFQDSGNSNYSTSVAATITGTTATYGSPLVFYAGAIQYSASTYSTTSNRIVVVYKDTANSNQGAANSLSLSNDLTIASDYYVQSDGTISTTSSTVPAGRALSTTSMLLEG
mgnify:CR=1 FL=1